MVDDAIPNIPSSHPRDDNDNLEWDSIWESLNWSDDNQTQDRLLERLQQRAEQYAVPTKSNDQETDALQMLSFQLGDEVYAIPVKYIIGVRITGRITRVPSVPDYYLGVVNVRGQIRSVFDLRRWFNLPASKEVPKEMILVGTQNTTLAFVVDHVDGIVQIPKAQIENFELSYAQGITPNKQVILDIEAIFDDPRLMVNMQNDGS